LRERRPGCFSRGSRAFLHFHEDAGDLYADVRLNSKFERMQVTGPREQTEFLSRVRATLADEPSSPKMEISWACGSTRRSAAEPGEGRAGGEAASLVGGGGLWAGVWASVTSKPRAASLPTWWAIWRRVVAWRS